MKHFYCHFILEMWQQHTCRGQLVVTRSWHKTRLTNTFSNVEDINQERRTPLIPGLQQWLILADWLIDLVQTSSELAFSDTLEGNLRRQSLSFERLEDTTDRVGHRRHTCFPRAHTHKAQGLPSLQRITNEVFCLLLSWVNTSSRGDKAPCWLKRNEPFHQKHSPWVIPCPQGPICLRFKPQSFFHSHLSSAQSQVMCFQSQTKLTSSAQYSALECFLYPGTSLTQMFVKSSRWLCF